MKVVFVGHVICQIVDNGLTNLIFEDSYNYKGKWTRLGIHYDFKSTKGAKLMEKKAKREKKLLQCISAFNGFSIYKTEKFIRNHYEWNVHKTLEIYPRSIVRIMSEAVHSDPIARHDDCEHRYFHISASQMNGSRICVSPNILFGVKQPSPTLFGLHRRMQR